MGEWAPVGPEAAFLWTLPIRMQSLSTAEVENGFTFYTLWKSQNTCVKK